LIFVTTQDRNERLTADALAMQALAASSDIFAQQSEGDAPDQYLVTFVGRGLSRGQGDDDVEIIETHQCEIRLTSTYPKRPPSVRWLTNIFHPNISYSGLIRIRDIGLTWTPDVGLDVVCERLWELARFSYMDLENASNRSAVEWLSRNSSLTLPSDPRPLRNSPTEGDINVIQYQRRDGNLSVPSSEASGEIFYIGEDTPDPEGVSGPVTEDDEVFYIGDE
jgi:hypothetical protein